MLTYAEESIRDWAVQERQAALLELLPDIQQRNAGLIWAYAPPPMHCLFLCIKRHFQSCFQTYSSAMRGGAYVLPLFWHSKRMHAHTLAYGWLICALPRYCRIQRMHAHTLTDGWLLCALPLYCRIQCMHADTYAPSHSTA